MVLGSQANWTWLSSETSVHVCVLVGNQSSSWGRRALYSGLPLRGVALGKVSSEENPRSVSKRRGRWPQERQKPREVSPFQGSPLLSQKM